MGIKTKDKKAKDKVKSKDKDLLKKKKKKKDDGAPVSRAKKGEKKKKRVIEVKPIKEKMNRTQILDHLVDETAVEKKDVKKVLAAVEALMQGSIMHKKGLGEFTWPGMFKITTKFKPKQKGGEKKKNPFKPGEFIITKPKPATVRVKMRPMKKLKDAGAIRKEE